eukprot:comp22406_c1_seq1/m.33495 comp22406_c1_seq1/g.33495  ORF comp22406_c1_seq1/g.33495 comp22406_c1_seq1/m.33495 type:complete len:407 (-) comp22406_c1_seq1:234-1454(-)
MPINLHLPPLGKKKRNVLGLSLTSPSSSGTPSGLAPASATASVTSEASDRSASSVPGSNPETPVPELLTHGIQGISLGPGIGEDGEGDQPVNRQEFVELVSDAKHKFRSGDTELVPEDLETLEQLGKGVSGVVEKVVHRPTQMVMARKLVHIELKPSVRKQISTELKVLYEAKSPYVVGFYGSHFADSDLSIFMEYMDAGSLETLYKRMGTIPEKILRPITKSIVMGLHELRENHCIVHRDIKPSNILMNTRGEVKLCDFGVSGQLVNSIAQTFTGTRSYMAPERLLGAQYAIQSDVWSLGLSVFEMAVGRFPIPPEGSKRAGLAIFELMEYIVNGPAPKLPNTFSSDFQDFIAMCLIKDAAKRPSPAQLLDHPWLADCTATNSDIVEWVNEALKHPVPHDDDDGF